MSEEELPEWEVCIKGSAGEQSFEIAIVRSDNVHGKRSYGWFDRDKLLVSHNGGPYSWPVNQRIWDGLVRLATQIAAEMNACKEPS